MSNSFKYLEYRDWLRAATDERKSTRAGFTYKTLSDAIRIQPPYLSRVFNKDAHLSSDQLFLACRELRFSEEEIEYAFLLHEWNRSDLPERRSVLERRVEAFREQRQDSRHHLEAEFVNPQQAELYQNYYLEPLAPLIHTFLSVPEYQAHPERIRTILGLSKSRFERIIQVLLGLGIIRWSEKEKRYEVERDHLHLDRQSTLNDAYQLLFRHAGIEHVKRVEESDKFQFTVTFSADEASRRTIRDEFNKFLSRVEPTVRSAPSEGVYQLTFDLFRWDARNLT